MERVESDTVWYCAACSGDITDEEKCVACDSCLQWSHFRCVGIKSAPKVKKHVQNLQLIGKLHCIVFSIQVKSVAVAVEESS